MGGPAARQRSSLSLGEALWNGLFLPAAGVLVLAFLLLSVAPSYIIDGAPFVTLARVRLVRENASVAVLPGNAPPHVAGHRGSALPEYRTRSTTAAAYRPRLGASDDSGHSETVANNAAEGLCQMWAPAAAALVLLSVVVGGWLRRRPVTAEEELRPAWTTAIVAADLGHAEQEDAKASDASHVSAPSVVTRWMFPEEVETVAALQARCFQPTEDPEDFFARALHQAEISANVQRLRQRQLDGDWICIVVESNGDIVACAEAIPRTGYQRHLFNVAVAPEARRSGFGRMAVEALEARCPEPVLTADVWQDAAPANAFWQALGYHLVGTFPRGEERGTADRVAGHYVKHRTTQSGPRDMP